MRRPSPSLTTVVVIPLLIMLLITPDLIRWAPTRSTLASTTAVYYGAWVPGGYSDISKLTAFEADAKKPVAIYHWYQAWCSTCSPDFQPTWMNSIRNHGSIPMISWEPDDWSKGTNQPAYSLANIINGTYDSYITKWAQAARAWGHPFFLRFAWEMNGNWESWSEVTNGNSAGQYVRAWRHVHDIFTTNSVTNVTWVWSPNVENAQTPIPLAEVYPGDAYVDWIGIDGYNGRFSSWQTFAQIFTQTYNDLLQISSTKPMMIAETGCLEQGGSKAAWITDALQTQIPSKFPNIKAIVWFNQRKNGRDWRIESSSSAQNAFATSVASSVYTSNQYAGLNTSPIPAP